MGYAVIITTGKVTTETQGVTSNRALVFAIRQLERVTGVYRGIIQKC